MGAKILKGAIVIAIFAGMVYASDRAGVPDSLPGAALGWVALFHVERAGAMLGAVGIVLLIGWRALSGEFPIKFGNLEYEVKEAASQAGEVADSHDRRIRALEVLEGIRDPDALEDGG